jgi:hypothetical protein
MHFMLCCELQIRKEFESAAASTIFLEICKSPASLLPNNVANTPSAPFVDQT